MNYKHMAIAAIARLAPNFWARRICNPIFIIGTARSGTTLLVDLIGTHPEILNWSEANNVWDPTGHPTPPGTAPVWVDPYAYNERWWHHTQEHGRITMIPATFAVAQTLQFKPYFVNKSPYNTFRIPRIMQMFPSARFIHIVRHGLAVVSSHLNKASNFVAEMPHTFAGDDTLYDFETTALCFARLWRLSLEEVEQQDAQLQLTERGLIHHLTYEDLCANTTATLAAVQQFIGLKQPIPITQEIDNRNDKWRGSFAPELVGKLVDEMNPAFSARGYTT